MLMDKDLAYVDRLIEIIKADDKYFALSRRLAMKKIRGPVEDSMVQSVNEAYESAMDLRRQFTEDGGGLFES